MINAYFNYPHSLVSAHLDPLCGNIRKNDKPGQRVIQIDPNTISSEIQNFMDGGYRFANSDEHRDMWIVMDFDGEDFEMALLQYINRLVGDYCNQFGENRFQVHCR